MRRLREEQRPASIDDLAGSITALPDDVGAVASEFGLSPDTLALAIDGSLAPMIWRGSTTQDRINHAALTFNRDLLASVENSLLAQERYEDFEQRLFRELGIEGDEPAGALKDFASTINAETKLAWNTAMVAANQGEDSISVWRSALMPTTTPACAARHGRPIDEIGETPPLHIACVCDVFTVPNPDSADPDVASEGQSMLDEMEAEREAWGAPSQIIQESARQEDRGCFTASLISC